MITLSAQIQGLSSRVDRSWKLTLGTQELNPNEIGVIGSLQNQVCFVAINPDPFTSQQKEAILNTKVELNETGKSHSKRLRDVLFRLYEQENEGYRDFNDFYINKMERIIKHYKSKLL